MLAPGDRAPLSEALGRWSSLMARRSTPALDRGELGALLAATLASPGSSAGPPPPPAPAGGRRGGGPAAGARGGGGQPLDLQVAVQRVEGLAPGLYRYDASGHALALLRGGSHAQRLDELLGRPAGQDADATVFLAGSFQRCAAKYAERAYRYVLLDAGHAACNLSLAAALLGLAAPWMARFDDVALTALLGLDGHAVAPLLAIPVARATPARDGPSASAQDGGPTPGAASRDAAPALAPPLPVSTRGRRQDLHRWMHGGTSLRLAAAPAHAAQPRQSSEPATAEDETAAPAAALGSSLPLPPPAPEGPLTAALATRRSTRRYSQTPMTAAELSACCRVASWPTSAQDAPLRQAAPRHLRVAVRAVAGVPAGVYAYDGLTHALQPVAVGDRSATLAEAGLGQAHLANAAAVLAPWHRWSALSRPDGPRGYRYAALDAGLAGELLYLQAGALGLGACGVGAFWDLPLAAALQLTPEDDLLLYCVAVGRRRI